MQTFVCADIGGTNTRLTLYEININKSFIKLNLQTQWPGKIIFNKKYNNADFKDFNSILFAFLQEASTGAPRTPAAACLAVAGPVKDNTVHLTNCKWTIEGAAVAAAFGIRTVLLINDFLAMGYGLLALTPQEVVPLQNAPKQTDKPIACIGAGTGLGECFLTPDSEGRYT